MPKNDLPTPVTSEEKFAAKAAGMEIETPTPVTNMEKYLDAIAKGGGVSPDDAYTKEQTDALLDEKVDKVSGKGLSTNDFTAAEKSKLSGIAAGAEVNVQANWTQTSSSADDFIKNKPTLGAAAAKGVDSTPTASSTNLVESGGVYAALAAKLNTADVDAALSSTSTNPVQNKVIQSMFDEKVDKVSGKGLSTNDFTAAEKSKLSGIAAGAEVNVQANWTQTSSSADDFIKNKPTLGAAAAKGVDSAPTASSTNLVESGGVYTALAAKASLEDILGVGIIITSNSSMDGLTAIGKWYCVNATIAVTVTNAPFTDAAYFGWTIRSIASSDRYVQIAIKNSDDFVIAKRRYSGVWSAWSYLTGAAVT